MIDGPAADPDPASPGPGARRAGSGACAARTAGQAWEVDGGVLVESGGVALEPGRLVEVSVTGNGAYDRFARLEPAPALGLLERLALGVATVMLGPVPGLAAGRIETVVVRDERMLRATLDRAVQQRRATFIDASQI